MPVMSPSPTPPPGSWLPTYYPTNIPTASPTLPAFACDVLSLSVIDGWGNQDLYLLNLQDEQQQQNRSVWSQGDNVTVHYLDHQWVVDIASDRYESGYTTSTFPPTGNYDIEWNTASIFFSCGQDTESVYSVAVDTCNQCALNYLGAGNCDGCEDGGCTVGRADFSPWPECARCAIAAADICVHANTRPDWTWTSEGVLDDESVVEYAAQLQFEKTTYRTTDCTGPASSSVVDWPVEQGDMYECIGMGTTQPLSDRVVCVEGDVVAILRYAGNAECEGDVSMTTFIEKNQCVYDFDQGNSYRLMWGTYCARQCLDEPTTFTIAGADYTCPKAMDLMAESGLTCDTMYEPQGAVIRANCPFSCEMCPSLASAPTLAPIAPTLAPIAIVNPSPPVVEVCTLEAAGHTLAGCASHAQYSGYSGADPNEECFGACLADPMCEYLEFDDSGSTEWGTEWECYFYWCGPNEILLEEDANLDVYRCGVADPINVTDAPTVTPVEQECSLEASGQTLVGCNDSHAAYYGLDYTGGCLIPCLADPMCDYMEVSNVAENLNSGAATYWDCVFYWCGDNEFHFEEADSGLDVYRCGTTDDVTMEPTEATPEPTKATLEPTDATLEPTDATLEPTDATMEPTDATMEPTEATMEPTDATMEPTEATTEPTEATLEPTEATLEPTEATLEPTDATAEPTIVTMDPTESTSEPTASTGEPTSSTSEAPTASDETGSTTLVLTMLELSVTADEFSMNQERFVEVFSELVGVEECTCSLVDEDQRRRRLEKRGLLETPQVVCETITSTPEAVEDTVLAFDFVEEFNSHLSQDMLQNVAMTMVIDSPSQDGSDSGTESTSDSSSNMMIIVIIAFGVGVALLAGWFGMHRCTSSKLDAENTDVEMTPGKRDASISNGTHKTPIGSSESVEKVL